ncbi:3823_t:CDS:2 [Entrophospora sp. SA101]|nr:3823_t:CDS:2 [Entrophospora sp. SA101]CAJ0829036.1 7508_t:CDS:2 [Entrophospora sp. SA101]
METETINQLEAELEQAYRESWNNPQQMTELQKWENLLISLWSYKKQKEKYEQIIKEKDKRIELLLKKDLVKENMDLKIENQEKGLEQDYQECYAGKENPYLTKNIKGTNKNNSKQEAKAKETKLVEETQNKEGEK